MTYWVQVFGKERSNSGNTYLAKELDASNNEATADESEAGGETANSHTRYNHVNEDSQTPPQTGHSDYVPHENDHHSQMTDYQPPMHRRCKFHTTRTQRKQKFNKCSFYMETSIKYPIQSY